VKSQEALLRRDHASVPAKVVYALERIATAISALKRDCYSKLGLSLTQGDILIFLATHSEKPGRVSLLSEEFLVSEATISEAVSALVDKGLIKKKQSALDARQVSLKLTPKAKRAISMAAKWEAELREILLSPALEKPSHLLLQLLLIIDRLLSAGVITEARMCLSCKFLEKRGRTGYFCALLQKPLKPDDLRIDCEDYMLNTADKRASESP